MTQAAEVFARRELAERRLTALRLSQADLQGDELTATFDHEGAAIEVHVSRERSAATLLTCAEVGEAHPWHYRLLALRPMPS